MGIVVKAEHIFQVGVIQRDIDSGPPGLTAALILLDRRDMNNRPTLTYLLVNRMTCWTAVTMCIDQMVW